MFQKKIPFKAGSVYHIWTHANGSENLFREEENYRYFLEKYTDYIHPVAETFAYCLMPNHLHLMIKVREREEVLKYVRVKEEDLSLQGFEILGGISKIISQQFSNFFNGYTQAYNKRYDRMGSLFIPNFKRKVVDTKEYFARLIAYIHHNPVHHGFVANLNDWPHSSWNAYLSDKNTKLNTEAGMKLFGCRENLMKVHDQLNMDQLTSIFEE